MIRSPLPFISSKRVVNKLGLQGEFYCSEDVVDFLISEIELLAYQSEPSEGYLSLSRSILMMTYHHPVVLKKVIFYGVSYGLKHKSMGIFIDVLTYIDFLFEKLGISASDRLSLCSARICINFEIYSQTQDIKFLSEAIENFRLIEQLLHMHPQLKNRLGWEHLRLGGKQEEVSLIASALVYQTVGRAFIELYHRHLELSDLIYGMQCLSLALDLSPNNPHIHSDYAKSMVVLGTREGKSSYIERGLEHFSKAIFLSFSRENDTVAYQNYRYSYALASVKLFDLTYKKEHFDQAIHILYQTVQAFPNLPELWMVWGELLIRSGWLNSNMKYVEAGLEKLASLQKNTSDPIGLSGLLASGIAILGLYLEEPNLFKESRLRLISAMRAFPGNSALVHALGVVQLCSALYFNEDSHFASAISCFQSCLEWDFDATGMWQKLFDAYFSWGVKKKNARLLRKAVDVASRLCSLRPEAFLFWSDRGLALKCLAEVTSDEAYKEIFLLESLLYYQKAWDLSGRVEILELWGHSHYLLADMQDNLFHYNEAYRLLTKDYVTLSSPRVKLLLAAVLLGKGKLLEDTAFVEEALAILEPLIEAHPEDEKFLLLLGKVYLFLFWKNKNIYLSKLTRTCLEKAISLGCSEAYYTLGKFYAITKDIEKAWGMVIRSAQYGVRITEAKWLNDPYLANLREIHTFREVVENQRERLWLASKIETKKK
ncbi:Predicted O-linked N-acetylglucosamine transferase, SPINDLY family [Chlamydia serpentis]|uniref:Predicted O-linked N-acetylglucosamine transferase, SPINDLY family n=1 Tax=Chlamydia serpentis TaxID=1967782 RepID=A0A2R8FAP6_9CHLA|nr:hypothetical protein [Chlamydia serpentis]SPN73431.1 Predicted O-linked N-acetylglucosamine transferase, SPINDLY family [Chlamydia serpentis]